MASTDKRGIELLLSLNLHPEWSAVAMRLGRVTSQFLCIALLLLTCYPLSAQSEKGRVRNIVLVHGAWADGHAVYVSRPKEVAALIEEAATHVR